MSRPFFSCVGIDRVTTASRWETRTFFFFLSFLCLCLRFLDFFSFLRRLAGAASSSESEPTVWNWRLRPWTSSRARARAAASPPSSDEDEDEEELLLLLLLLDERPIVTRRRGAAFTRLFRGAARLLIHGARLRSPLLPRRLSQRRRPRSADRSYCAL